MTFPSAYYQALLVQWRCVYYPYPKRMQNLRSKFWRFENFLEKCCLHLSSGNLMGDVGLRILSRILVLNTHLRELSWDRNCLSLQSLEEVAKALEQWVLLSFPFVIHGADNTQQTFLQQSHATVPAPPRLRPRPPDAKESGENCCAPGQGHKNMFCIIILLAYLLNNTSVYNRLSV